MNFRFINQLFLKLRATSPTSQEPWPWNCESPKGKCSKVVRRHLQNHVLWSQILKCSVKSYVTMPSTKCYFNEFLFIQILTHDKFRINQRLWAFGMPESPNGFLLGLLPRAGFWKQSKWPWNMIHSMPCRIDIHPAFTYSLRWSLKRSVM
jgi:hypothetical protein